MKIKEPCLVSCLGNNEAWISGGRGNMTRVDSEGSVLETVITKSGGYPDGLAVTSDGDLLYTDFTNKTICRVRNGKADVLIRTEGHPSGICATSSGDILVVLYDTHVKIVRYTGTSKTQDIPYGESKRALVENDEFWLQIAENRNGDICVSDLNSKAVVILSQEGKAKSRYVKVTNPHCITTDSLGHILVSDNLKHCVHNLDSHGAGLSIINNCLLNVPVGVSVDNDDRLWVVEEDSGKLKIIKYMK
ncbi:serine/threonine-protein kinase PknD-like [Saccostrea echinata]|uniref:serine/threonine-protein kinase PknD-like n=1 Tax=Saccostrea echinata TaxID=191078 RepID=UPI002A83DF96|nr:serine/threonine-protein kinase PknD-like [Saccostrea echinata]